MSMSRSELCFQSIKASVIFGLARLAKHPACEHSITKTRIGHCGLLYPWKELVEMVFKQVLEKAGGYGRAQIGILLTAPLQDEAPDIFRVAFDESSYLDDCLPSGIKLTLRSAALPEKAFGPVNSLLDCHNEQGTPPTDVWQPALRRASFHAGPRASYHAAVRGVGLAVEVDICRDAEAFSGPDAGDHAAVRCADVPVAIQIA